MADSQEPKRRSGEPEKTEVHLDAEQWKRVRIARAAYDHLSTGNTASEAWTVYGSTPDYPEFPRVQLGTKDATITYRGNTYVCVNLTAAEMLKAILDEAPKPLGLTQLFGPHPERVLDKLPIPIRERLESQPGNKGYLFVP